MAALPLVLLASILIAAAAAAYQPMGPKGAAEPQWRPLEPQNISGVRVKRTPFAPPGSGPLGLPGWSGLYPGLSPVQGPPGVAQCHPCIKTCFIQVNCKCVLDLQCAHKEFIKPNKTRPFPPFPPALPRNPAAAAPTTTPAAQMTTTTARVQLLPCPQKCHKLGENGVCVEDFHCLQADHDVTGPATSTGPSHNVSETWESTPQPNLADRLQKVFITHLLSSVTLLVVWL